MFPLGHVVTAAVANRVVNGDEAWALSIAGALLPDIVDKPSAWVFKNKDTSHRLGHSALGVVGVALASAAVSSGDSTRRLTVAYLSHLLADEFHHGRVPWLYPFSDWKRRPKARSRRNLWVGLALEGVALGCLSLYAVMHSTATSTPLRRTEP